MHELGLAQEIVEAVLARAEGARVLRVIVKIGKLAPVMPDALRFSFTLVAEESGLTNTELTIIDEPGLGRCRDCNADVIMHKPLTQCSCGGSQLEWLSGEN